MLLCNECEQRIDRRTGSCRRCNRSRAHWAPSRQQIKRACRLIRLEWDRHTRRDRIADWPLARLLEEQ